MNEKAPSRGGRPGISLDDVRAAAERLTQQGRNVGPTNIRLELGRGSYGTIQKYLRTLGLAADNRFEKS